jgi:hypothetical protein
MPCTDAEIAQEMATLAKGDHRSGKDLIKIMNYATAPLEFKFGVTSGLTIKNTHGEIEDSNYTSNEIADIFPNNGRVLHCLVDWVKQYDMEDATNIPMLNEDLVDANKGKWGAPTIDMLEDVKTLSMKNVKAYTSDVLKFKQKNGTGHQDQLWLLKLVQNSCSSYLCDIANKKFIVLPVNQQGGLVYLKLIYNVIFKMTEPVVCTLQTWIKGFAKHSLYKVQGKNVWLLYNAAWNICKHLDSLPTDAAINILTGLTKANNDTFTNPFKLLKDLSNQTIIDLGILKTKTTLEWIKTYLTQALDSYVIHIFDGTWKVKSLHAVMGNLVCWNCGKEGHDLCSCPALYHQNCIEKACSAFHENRKKTSAPGVTKTLGKGGNNGGYSCGKFGKPPAKGESVHYIHDKHHAWCGTCGWTTTHSTKFHEAWSTRKSTFVLHDKYPLVIDKKKGKKDKGNNRKGNKNKTKSSKTDADAKSPGPSMAAISKHQKCKTRW